MRTKEEVEKIIECYKKGLNKSQAAKQLNIPRATIRDYYKKLLENKEIFANNGAKLKDKSIEEITDAVKNSLSYAKFFSLLNIIPGGSSFVSARKIFSKHNIDVSHWKGQGWNAGETLATNKSLLKGSKHNSLEEIFCIDSKANPNLVRKLMVTQNVFEKKCIECGLSNCYNNKPLNLQLDHINGIRTDNRIENLRWLCPNCHSQTETYCGKNIKRKRMVEEAELIEALKNNDNILQALKSVGLTAGQNYKRAKKLLEKIK